MDNFTPLIFDLLRLKSGILAESSATEIRFVDSEITGSARGFFLENNVNFETTNGTFLDNTISIATLNFTTGGPYPGSSYVNLDGGRFEYGWIPVLAFHPNTSLFVEMDKLLYTPTAFTSSQVYISESNGVQIGIGSNTTNTFEVADDASVLSLASEATIANNYFSNCPSAIYGEESILIVGGISTEQNTFEKSSFFLTNGAQYLQSNFLNQGSGIIQFPTNQTVNGQTGTYIFDNSAANNSNLIVVGQNNAERRVHILNNNPWLNSAIQVEDIPTFSLATGVLIESNIFTSSNGPTGTPYQLALKNTAGVRVGGNSFEDHPPVAGTPAIRQPAIYAEDIRGGQIKDNDFYHRHIGFHGVGNLGVFNSQDFVISCNHFVHNETCMLFDPTAISPQANGGFAVDNTFAVLFGLPVPFTSVNNLSSLPLIYNYSNQSPDTNPISTSWSPNNIIPLLVTNPVFSACALQKSQIEIIKSYTRIYPNPVTSNSITINLENDYSEYQIFDLQGRVLKKGDLHFGVNSIAINLSSGTYFYSIINKQNQSVENGKIIIL